MKRPPQLALHQNNADNRHSSPSPPTSHSSRSTSDRDSPSASDTTNDEDHDQVLSDDFDLELLEKLRRNVQKNLELRPLMSAPIPVNLDGFDSPPLSTTSTVFFTPVEDVFDTRFLPRGPPLHSARPAPLTAVPGIAQPTAVIPSDQPSTDKDKNVKLPRSAPIEPSRPARAVLPARLAILIGSSQKPLLIDCRPAQAFTDARIRGSVSLALPSLILKRFRKQGLPSLDALKPFLTADDSREVWDALMADGRWSGSVVLYDDAMDPKLKDDKTCTSWALVPMITPLLSNSGGSVNYLKGGFSAFAAAQPGHISRDEVNVIDDSAASGGRSGGLFQLDTWAASRSKPLPEIERPPSPKLWLDLHGSTASPPPSALAYGMQKPGKRPSAPNLRKLDTKSTERLKTNLTTRPSRAATLAVPPLSIGLPSPSPRSPPIPQTPDFPGAWPGSAHPNRAYDNIPPPSPSFQRPKSPRTPKPPPTPLTARPDGSFPGSQSFRRDESEDQTFPSFQISTILPNFLYLGPELTTAEHVAQLQSLGVKRIVNIAAECGEDDHGLGLKATFDRYFHIPMRDIVEEKGITKGVREACDIIDDARLHSAPVYVHCKAGKSRSVTAVIAYLIHANHWTLSRAYAFVLERRTGISPNIGFVSELMTFEEQELGGKSVGVVQPSPQGGEHEHTPHAMPTARRPGLAHPHARESLPPFATNMSFETGPMSAGGAAARGDAGQEMEIRDAAGRYRHARRAPVDENTLQPLRRVSKAGLESSLEGMF